MKSKFFPTVVVAVAALSGFSAFAQGNIQNRLYGEAANKVTFDTTPSKLTRAQVQTEFLNASKNNALPLTAEAGFPPAVVQTSALTRKQFVASMGKVHALDGSEKLTQH